MSDKKHIERKRAKPRKRASRLARTTGSVLRMMLEKERQHWRGIEKYGYDPTP